MMLRCLLLFAIAAAACAAERPHVVFVTGDDEYRSEITMPMIAGILEKRHGLRTSVCYARPTPQTKNNIEGLEALASADLMVIFVRFRELPDDQLRRILDYTDAGKPVVGLRTATHAFRYPKDHKHAALNVDFGRGVLGREWVYHYGNTSSTDVTLIPEQRAHPILRGVEPAFHARSWLYQVVPLAEGAVPLATGVAVNTRREGAVPNPVAWTKTNKGGRVFFTTMGHPEDFTVESFRRMLINGILWALGKDVPKGGANAAPVAPYTPPPTT